MLRLVYQELQFAVNRNPHLVVGGAMELPGPIHSSTNCAALQIRKASRIFPDPLTNWQIGQFKDASPISSLLIVSAAPADELAVDDLVQQRLAERRA